MFHAFHNQLVPEKAKLDTLRREARWFRLLRARRQQPEPTPDTPNDTARVRWLEPGGAS